MVNTHSRGEKWASGLRTSSKNLLVSSPPPLKSKRGQVLIYALMLGMVVIILGLALAPAIQEQITSSTNESSGDFVGMNCSTTTDSFVKAGCIVSDISLFYVIGVFILIGCAVIVAKIGFGGS